MVVHEWSVVVFFCGDAQLMDLKEVMLTSHPELAHCGGGGVSVGGATKLLGQTLNF